jgi:hypothetical protein
MNVNACLTMSGMVKLAFKCSVSGKKKFVLQNSNEFVPCCVLGAIHTFLALHIASILYSLSLPHQRMHEICFILSSIF